jgi:hypothetical protein
VIRLALVTALTLAITDQGFSQPVNLTEKITTGDQALYTVELELKGNLIVLQEGKKEFIPVEAKARHHFTQLIVGVKNGLPVTTARLYDEAVASLVVAAEKVEHRLPSDRQLIIAQQTASGQSCFSPAGPLTQDELDLVSEHFSPHSLPGLLPGKVVKVGETWTPNDEAIKIACLFDELVKSDLQGKLIEIKDRIARFSIAGSAEGLEGGARVKLDVTAKGTFELDAGCITTLEWKQHDHREQGPINPASQVEATITLRRTPSTDIPKALADPTIARLTQGAVPPRLLELQYTDPQKRYRMVYPRAWHITGQTDSHLILRWLERGELVAQATLSVWRQAEPGKHISVNEFKKAVSEAPGWIPGKILADGEVPIGSDRWLYRVTVEGKMEDTAIVQSFFLLVGPQGEQIAVTVAMKPEQYPIMSERSLALVKAIEPGKK